MKRTRVSGGVLVLMVCAVAVASADSGTIWDKQINGKGRFEVRRQFNAHGRCNRLTTGDRLGWRLPALQELASLVDPSAAMLPRFLPAIPSRMCRRSSPTGRLRPPPATPARHGP